MEELTAAGRALAAFGVAAILFAPFIPAALGGAALDARTGRAGLIAAGAVAILVGALVITIGG